MPRKYFSNEGKCCDAVLRQIEARDGAGREGLTRPEREGHSAPVDLACYVAGRRYAFEHTGIEPFEGFVQLIEEAKFRTDPIVERLTAKLPNTDIYEIEIPAGALSGLKGAELRRAQRAIGDWVVSVAPKLEALPYGQYARGIQAVVPGTSIHVALLRWKAGPFPPRVQISNVVQDHHERRRERIQRAVAKKAAQLAPWKRAGARTVLVFEMQDVQLSNHWGVAESLARAERTLDVERPDEVFLVEVLPDGPWWVLPIRIDDRGSFQLEADGMHVAEIDPHALIDLTAVNA